MRITPAYVLLFCISIGNIYSQDLRHESLNSLNSTPNTSLFNSQSHASLITGENIFITNGSEKKQEYNNNEKNSTVGCPPSIPLAAIDTAGINSILNGGVIACNASPFYVYTNYAASIVDSISSLFSPTIQLSFNTYQTALGTNGKVTFYENGAYLSCLGPLAPCSFPIGYSATIGSRWTLYKCHAVNGGKQHSIVFSTTAAIPTTTVTVKSPWTNTVFNSFIWSASGVSSQTVTLPANTNIGTSTFSINPVVTNTLAVTDLKNGYCYINPRLLPLNTYTVTYTFKDTICTGASANFIFTVGLPNVSWTTPKLCLPGPSINLNSTLSSTAQTGGTWTGTGVSGGIFNPSVGLGTYTVTYTIGSGTCTNMQSHSVMVNATPTVSVASASICPGLSTTLNATGASTYTWVPSNGLSATSGASVIANPTLTTNYTITGTAVSLCSNYSTALVTVFPKPVANYSVSSQSVFISNPIINFTDQSTGASISSWKWTFGDGGTSALQNPIYTYSSVGNYGIKFITTSTFGCKDSTSGTVDIIAANITVYNSFSPNGDGLNDQFEIDNIDKFGANHVSIYNRWGQLLWDRQDYNNTSVVWDGKDNKGTILSAGTYFYIIEVNGKKTEKHWVELTK